MVFQHSVAKDYSKCGVAIHNKQVVLSFTIFGKIRMWLVKKNPFSRNVPIRLKKFLLLSKNFLILTFFRKKTFFFISTQFRPIFIFPSFNELYIKKLFSFIVVQFPAEEDRWMLQWLDVFPFRVRDPVRTWIKQR